MSNQHPIVYKSPDKVRHPNKLTKNFIKWKFTPAENRVMVNILQRVKSNQKLNKPVQIDFEENISLRFHWKDLVPVSHNGKNYLIEALDNLRKKTIILDSHMHIDNKVVPSEKMIGIIDKAEWTKAKSCVDLKLDVNWYKFLLDISKGFTEYSSVISCKLSSSYSIKFYYFICQWFKTGGRSLTLEQFRKEFSIPEEKYLTKTASSFRQKIIDPAKKTLDEISDKSFNYSIIKDGRSIVGFTFQFYKTNNDVDVELDWKAVNLFLDDIKQSFTLKDKEDIRIVGLIRKYTLPVVRSVYNLDFPNITSMVLNGKSVVNTLSNLLKEYVTTDLPKNSDRMDKFYRKKY